VRTVTELVSFDCGPHQANMISFDPAGAVLAVASNDASIKICQLSTGKITTTVGHEDSVQCLTFDQTGQLLVSGSSDQTIRLWS